MRALDTTLRWLVRASLAIGLIILSYVLFTGFASGSFRSAPLGPVLLFAGAWIVPAIALGCWRNDTAGPQSIAFYSFAVLGIGLIACLGLFLAALNSAFS